MLHPLFQRSVSFGAWAQAITGCVTADYDARTTKDVR
jgi:hypothetical protein